MLQTCWEDPYIINIIIIQRNDAIPDRAASQAKVIVVHMDRLALYTGLLGTCSLKEEQCNRG